MSTVATAISSVLLTFSRKKSILMYTRKAELSAQLTMEKAYYIFNDNAKKRRRLGRYLVHNTSWGCQTILLLDYFAIKTD